MKLNLINREKSDIGYSIFRFPDGEVQMILGEFSRKEVVDIECRITNAEELFVLMQTCDILNRHGVMFSISIYYLMSMRMDRVMDFSRPYTLKIVVGILDNLGAFSISVFCPHSEMSLDLFKMTPVTLIRPNTLVYYGANHFRSYQMRDVLQEITGFGSLSKCSLCTAIVEDNIQYSACPYCIYRNFRDFAAPCVYHETYEAIEKSKNLDELMEAIRNRADYLEELIEKVKNDN